MGHLDNITITCPDWEKALCSYHNVLSSGIESLQVKATIKLAHLSKYAPDDVLTRTVPILTKLLATSSSSSNSNNSIQEAAAYCLSILLVKKMGFFASAIGQSGILDSILSWLPRSNNSFRRVLIKCLWCLVNFDSANRLIVGRNGGLEVIIDLLNSCSDGNRVYLLEILSALTLLREVRRVVIRLGGLRFLVEAVKDGSLVSRERACQAVGLLGVTRRARSMLVAMGAIPALVELLQNGDWNTKLVAGNSLGVISAHVDFIRLVAEAGAIPLYAELLQGPDPIGKEIAEDVFCILAVAQVNAVTIAEHLVRILREGDDESKVAASDIFWDLSGYKHSVSVVRNSGAIPVLVELLRHENSDVREKVSGAIAQLSYNEADRAALAAARAVPILIELLLDESEELKENAAEALVNFAEDPQQHALISEAVDVPSFQSMQNRMVQLRVSDEQMVRSLRRLSVEQLTWDPDLA
ncbi:U-box domain-containing protein 13 [Ricinus communis]|uniref:U-box domain-containing protein 13 n=1 Tax=Ricinus communis TaxID=3988 RepID=UPI00201B1AF2|nr:U-box domain-containing protein 13 [Ricinus communis]